MLSGHRRHDVPARCRARGSDRPGRAPRRHRPRVLRAATAPPRPDLPAHPDPDRPPRPRWRVSPSRSPIGATAKPKSSRRCSPPPEPPLPALMRLTSRTHMGPAGRGVAVRLCPRAALSGQAKSAPSRKPEDVVDAARRKSASSTCSDARWPGSNRHTGRRVTIACPGTASPTGNRFRTACTSHAWRPRPASCPESWSFYGERRARPSSERVSARAGPARRWWVTSRRPASIIPGHPNTRQIGVVAGAASPRSSQENARTWFRHALLGPGPPPWVACSI